MDVSKQCDGYPDCLYGEDEQNCPYDDEEQEVDGEDVVDESTGIKSFDLTNLNAINTLCFPILKFCKNKCTLKHILDEYEPPNEEVACDALDEFRCADGRECILKGKYYILYFMKLAILIQNNLYQNKIC